MILFIIDFFFSFYRFETRKRVSSLPVTRDYVLAFEIYGGKKEGWRLVSVLFAFEVRAPCNSCAIDAESDIGLRDSFVAHTLNITRRFTYYVGDTFLRAHAHTNETFVFNMGKRASLRIYNAKKFFFFLSLFFSFLFLRVEEKDFLAKWRK